MSGRALVADVRLGQRWTRAQTAKNDALHAAAMAALAVVTRLPLGLRRVLGARVGELAWLMWASGRRACAEHLERALGPDAPGSLTVFRGLGRTLADLVEGLRAEPRFPLVLLPGDAATLADAVACGRGVVFATAHLGPWESMGPVLVRAGFRVATIARESYDPRFDALYARLRERHGVRALYRGAPSFPRELVRALRTGTIMGFPMDLAGRGVRTVDVLWFDRPLPTPIGPAELALRTGAAIVVATPTPHADGLRLAIERIDTTSTESPADVTARLATSLARRIRELPDAWPWMHHGSGRNAVE